MRPHNYLATLAICFWYVLLGVIFVIVRPELAYSYGHWLGEFTGNLPRLTEVLSLPLLGPAISTPSQDYTLVFWLAWGFLFLPPAVALGRLWRVGADIDLMSATAI